MKWIFRTFLLLGTLTSAVLGTGCADENDGKLVIGATPAQAFFLPSDTTSSSGCFGATTITAPRFSFANLTTTWSGAGAFTPAVIVITIKGSSFVSDYTCTLSGGNSSLGTYLGYGGTSLAAPVAPAESTIATSTCPIDCPSVTVTDTSANFTVNARVKLIGTTIEGDTEKPVSGETTISIENIAL